MRDAIVLEPVFSILGVFRLIGQPERDGGIKSGPARPVKLGLTDKGCDSCREPCFLSVFVVFGSPANGVKAH